MSKLLPPVFVPLTGGQEDALQPFLAQLTEWSNGGKPGMLIAQVFPDHMVVGLVDPERATDLSKTGRVIRAAFDRDDVHYPPRDGEAGH